MATEHRHEQSAKPSATAYYIGYILSLGLTLAAYLLVQRYTGTHQWLFSMTFILGAISALAVVQMFVQLVFFLHLDRESKPWWNNTVLAFAASVVIIIVFGSLWIMASLNYHHDNSSPDHMNVMSPHQTDEYIIHDEGVHH